MVYFSDLDIERQDYEATTGDYSHDQEPDQQDYDAGYDEYKERKAGLFKEMGIDDDPELDFLDIGNK